LSVSLILCALALALPAVAEDEQTPVPLEKAAYHWPVFSNEHVMVLRVIFPPGRGSNYHIHSLDQISVQVEAGANAGQVLGEAPTPARPGTKGQVSFTAYSKKTFIHRSTNTAATPYQNIVIALLKPKPAGLAPAARPDGYVQVFDNERARGWKLALEPGQSVGPVTQSAPGLRVIIDSGEIVEIVSGQPDRGLALRLGDFYWQDPGAAYGTSERAASRSRSSN